MADPVVDEEVKVQTDMIADVLEGFIPSSTTTQPEVSTNVEEGKEQPAEAAVEQVQTPAAPVKEEAKVEPVEPVAQVQSQEVVAQVVAQPVVPAQAQAPTEVELLRKQIEEMRQAMVDMAGGKPVEQPQPIAPTVPVQPQAQHQVQAQPASQPTIDQQMNMKQILRFLPDDGAYDEVTKNAENFNILLTNVVNTAVERSLRMLPSVASKMVEAQVNLKTTVDEFYRVNEDLLPFRKFVGFVTAELAAKHADWDMETLLKESNTTARERLKLPTRSAQPQVQAQVQAQAQTPGFVPGSGNRGRRGTAQVESPTGQEQQIADLLS